MTITSVPRWRERRSRGWSNVNRPVVAALCLATSFFGACSQNDAGSNATSITDDARVAAGFVGGGFVVTGTAPLDLLGLPKSVGGVRGNDGVWTSVSIRLGDLTRGVSFQWDEAGAAPVLSGAQAKGVVLQPGRDAQVFISSPAVWVQWVEGDFVITVEGVEMPEDEVVDIARRTRFDPSKSQDVGTE